ncbi:MAG TPA: hypothetical protein ENJ60_15820 [Aeromonadales bacterium]|nr:hypothetical protein [Aeromonadales bacterium]
MADKTTSLILASNLIDYKDTGRIETVAGVTGKIFKFSYQSKKVTKTIKLVLSSDNDIRGYTHSWLKLTRKKYNITGESFSNKNIWRFLEKNNYGILKFYDRFQVTSVATNLNEMSRISLPGESSEPLKNTSNLKIANNTQKNANKELFDSRINTANQTVNNNADFKKIINQYVGSDEEIAKKMADNKKNRNTKLSQKGRKLEENHAQENKAAIEALKLKVSKKENLFPDLQFSMMSKFSGKGNNSSFNRKMRINHIPKMTRFAEQKNKYSHFFIYREDKNIIWQMIPGTGLNPGNNIYWQIDSVDGKGRDPHIDNIIKAYENIRDLQKLTYIGNEVVTGISTRHYKWKKEVPWEDDGFIYYNYWIENRGFIIKVTIQTSESESTLSFYDFKFESQPITLFTPPNNFKNEK